LLNRARHVALRFTAFSDNPAHSAIEVVNDYRGHANMLLHTNTCVGLNAWHHPVTLWYPQTSTFLYQFHWELINELT
jgi:hypothetical protein